MNELQKRFEKEINEVVEVCRHAGELGFGASSGGNVSYKVDEDLVLITPTGIVKRKIGFDDICIVNAEGQPVYIPEGRKPTGEMFMHLHVLKMRPDVKGIMHAHPPLAIGMSLSDKGIEMMKRPIFPDAVTQLGPIFTIPYVKPNCDELGYSFDPYVMRSNAFIMANHGCLVLGPNGVKETVEYVQIMEGVANSIMAATALGKDLRELTEKELDGLDELLKKRGAIMPGPLGAFSGMRELFANI